jgi:hypothetical protein
MSHPVSHAASRLGASTDFIREVEDLENVIFVCFGCPSGSDLPQIGDEENIIVDLVQHMTGKTHELVEAEIRHQTDGSYQ